MKNKDGWHMHFEIKRRPVSEESAKAIKSILGGETYEDYKRKLNDKQDNSDI